jgi:hypothetical protein
LHDHLTWDDKIAGTKWRVNEMRSIIRSIVLITSDEDNEEPTRRSWLSIGDKDGVSYRDVEQITVSNDAACRLAARDNRSSTAGLAIAKSPTFARWLRRLGQP